MGSYMSKHTCFIYNLQPAYFSNKVALIYSTNNVVVAMVLSYYMIKCYTLLTFSDRNVR